MEKKSEPQVATKPKRPSHIIWQVVGDKDDARWIRVGAAWPNKDAKSMSLKFDSYPIVGRIMLRENKESVEETAAE